MLNSIQVAGLIVITLLLLFQLRSAAERDRPVLWLMTLVFFVYFVYSGGIRLDWNMREWSHTFDVSEHYITVATWLVVVIIIAVRCGYSISQRPKATRVARGIVVYDQFLLLFLSVLGLGAMALVFHLRGDVVSVWSRSVDGPVIPWAGVLSGLSDLALVYPLFTYYYLEDSTVFRLTISVIILAIYGVLAMVSGVSTHHVMRLTPFLLVWLTRRRLTLVRTVLVVVAAFVVFSFLRFSRQLGVAMYLGGGLREAYAAYSDPDNCLNAENSFGEFITFSQVVQVVDRHTDWQWGGSYLLAPVGLVPGVLLPGKAELGERVSAGMFLPSYYGVSGITWTVGFYGEAYMNFGLPGLIVISFLFGWLMRKAEVLLKSEGAVSWLPHWYIGCALAATLTVLVRNESVEALGFLLPIGLAIVFGELMSLLLPYGPVRTVSAVVVYERSSTR